MERTVKILLVDDEEDFLDPTSKRLRRRGFEVRTATRCGEALPEVAAGWPDVVVLDVMLPDVDGIEQGASDYCLKPIELDALVEKIRIALKDAAA